MLREVGRGIYGDYWIGIGERESRVRRDRFTIFFFFYTQNKQTNNRYTMMRKEDRLARSLRVKARKERRAIRKREMTELKAMRAEEKAQRHRSRLIARELVRKLREEKRLTKLQERELRRALLEERRHARALARLKPSKWYRLRSNKWSSVEVQKYYRSQWRCKPVDSPQCDCARGTSCDDDVCINAQLYQECARWYCPSLDCEKPKKSSKSKEEDTKDKMEVEGRVGREGRVEEKRGRVEGEEEESEEKTPLTLSEQGWCANTRIQRRDYPLTEIFLTEKKGWGLRAAEDIRADAILAEYTGEVIDVDELTSRIEMKLQDGNTDLYFAHLSNGLFLDAEQYGSVARFANHCCDGNATMQKWIVLGEPRIVLVEKRALSAGEEMTYNYGSTFKQCGDSKMKGFQMECHCGSPICAGFVGGAVDPKKKRKEWRL